MNCPEFFSAVGDLTSQQEGPGDVSGVSVQAVLAVSKYMIYDIRWYI
jgi:hypothetical protein